MACQPFQILDDAVDIIAELGIVWIGFELLLELAAVGLGDERGVRAGQVEVLLERSELVGCDALRE